MRDGVDVLGMDLAEYMLLTTMQRRGASAAVNVSMDIECYYDTNRTFRYHKVWTFNLPCDVYQRSVQGAPMALESRHQTRRGVNQTRAFPRIITGVPISWWCSTQIASSLYDALLW